jgi:hypothetical protein
MEFVIATVMVCKGGLLFPAVNNYSLLHGVQINSGARPDSYLMDSGGSFSGGKAAVR